jgi:hypothetical protein
MVPPLRVEDEGPLTKKEINSGVIHAFTFLPYDRHGRAGFHHLPTWVGPGSPVNLPEELSTIDRHYQHWGLRKW